MSNKKPHIVKIKGKGTDGMGVTEDLARQMCTTSSKGKRYMAVVEVMVDVIHDGLAQKISDLSIEQFWPATDDDLDNHLRELTRVLHQNKALASEHDEPLEFDDGPSPRVADVIAEGERLRPHDFEPDGSDTDTCNVCGDEPDAAVHAGADQLADPFSLGATAEDDPEPADPDNPAYEPHDFIPDADGNCDDGCGQPADAPIHTTVDADTEAPVPA